MESDWLLITFNPMTMRAHGTAYWGDIIARKNNISSLGFISTSANWFPREDMLEIIERAKPILSQYKNIVCYGMSMGGYGALKYSKLLGARTVISFSPQYSINPRVTEGRDERYSRYFRESTHLEMEVSQNDLTADCFATIFYDPGHRQDAYCAEMYSAVGNIRMAAMHHMGHGTIASFAGTEKTQILFEKARAGDIHGLRAAARRFKRLHVNRLYNIAHKAVKNHPLTAFRIFDSHPHVLSGSRSVEFAKQCIKTARVDAAVEWASGLVRRNPENSSFQRLLGTLYFAANNISAGRSALAEAFRLNPDDHNARHLAQALLAHGDYEESIEWARRAYVMNAQSAQNIMTLVQALERADQMEEAKKYADEAIFRHPQNGSIRFMRERLLKA